MKVFKIQASDDSSKITPFFTKRLYNVFCSTAVVDVKCQFDFLVVNSRRQKKVLHLSRSVTNTSRFTKKSMSGLKSSLISLEGQLHNNRLSKFLMQHFSCLPLTFSEFRNLCESFRALYNPSSYGSVSQFLFHKATKNDPLSHRWDAGSSLVIPSPKFFEFP